MGKRRRRAKRKASFVQEFIPGLVVLLAIYLYLNGISFDKAFSYVAAGMIFLLIALAAVWFVRGSLKSSEPANPKKEQPGLRKTDSSLKITRNESIAAPTKWSEELIAQLEWRVFEKLCIRLWQEKSFSVKETGAGADGGVDFYLYATATEQKIGAVQCKSWSKRQIDVKVVRELQGVVASEELKLGLLMYSGKLSKAAEEFIANPAVSVKAQGNIDILNEIHKLDAEKQIQLINELFTEDHQVPSCPKCDVKLVERTAKKTGNTFWGCTNFPRCRFTMRL